MIKKTSLYVVSILLVAILFVFLIGLISDSAITRFAKGNSGPIHSMEDCPEALRPLFDSETLDLNSDSAKLHKLTGGFDLECVFEVPFTEKRLEILKNDWKLVTVPATPDWRILSGKSLVSNVFTPNWWPTEFKPNYLFLVGPNETLTGEGEHFEIIVDYTAKRIFGHYVLQL